jgi:hypothetical protein
MSMGSGGAAVAVSLCLLGLAPGASFAQSAPAGGHAYVVRYIGDVGCEDWLNQPDRADFPREAVLNWVLGYLSRAAVARGVDLLRPADQEAIIDWMNTYCAAHARSTVLTGASSLEKAMADGQGPRSAKLDWP